MLSGRAARSLEMAMKIRKRKQLSGTRHHSSSALQAKAIIDAYFNISEKWADPWSPCLTDHPPSPRELEPTVDWSVAGDFVVTKCQELLMPPEHFNRAMAVRNELEACLQEEMPNDNLKLFTFGSCMSGLGTATSDLDTVIMRYDSNGWSLNPTSRDEQTKHLKDYHNLLSRRGFTNLKHIPAKVPILRRESPERDGEVNFDICLFFHGVRNSLQLREYARSCPFFMPMSIVLREWGKSMGILNSVNSFLTPYCLNVMLINYLVREVSPSYLVPVPPLVPPSYYPTAPSQYLPPPREMQRREKKFVKDLGLHVAGFLRYYACLTYSDKVISAVNPLNDSRADSVLWEQNSTDLVIEEMFAQQDQSLPIPNMGHKVDALRLLAIREKMFYAYLHLVKNGYLPADPEHDSSGAWDPFQVRVKPPVMVA